MEDDESWAGLGFRDTEAVFESAPQNARRWTEGWAAAWLFCPSCGAERLSAFRNNNPVGDFFCAACAEEFELKSLSRRLTPRLNDGAYGAMMARLAAANNPNLFVMTYDPALLRVTNLLVIPKQFFTPAIIEPRRPLSSTARRAGWQGCNILLRDVPRSGQIYLIRDGALTPRSQVLEDWRRTLFLRETSGEARGWLIEVMKCVEALARPEFELADVYAFEARLAALYPGNNNVRPKIRQQLQVLRDRGFLEFAGRGAYRLRA